MGMLWVSGAVHAVERAHVSTARACKSGLAGWGKQAGAAAAPRTSDGPQGSAGHAGQRQAMAVTVACRDGGEGCVGCDV